MGYPRYGKKKKPWIEIRGQKKTGCVLLSQGLPLSTIAAGTLHFCVRNGNRCFLPRYGNRKIKKSQLHSIEITATRMYALKKIKIKPHG